MTGSRGFIFRIRRPNPFLRQAPPNRRGPEFSVPANVESRRKVLLTERAFRVPVRAGLQGRQQCRFSQLLGAGRLSYPYIVVNKQGFTAGQRFGRDSFVSRSNRKQ